VSYGLTYLETKSLSTSANYPYTSGFGRTGQCDTSREGGELKVSEFYNVNQNDVNDLFNAVASGVVSVSIEADQLVFQQYTGGIITSAACGVNLDHAVNAVGYGMENGINYFIVRNSWGAGWGQSGYVNIAATVGLGTCGINRDAVYPTIVTKQ